MGCCLHGLRSGSDPTVFSWYTVCCTECSPSQYRIRISCKTRQPACTADQVSFHFFPVKIGIVAVYNAPLHQKCCTSGHKRCRHGSPGTHLIAAARCAGHDLHPRSHKIGLYLIGCPRITSPGKCSCLVKSRIVCPDSDHFRRCRGNRESCLLHRI